jgi:Family of unknown function (DUF6152)
VIFRVRHAVAASDILNSVMTQKLFLLLALVSASLAAHHSIASYYDANKVTTIKGTLTKIEWRSPHAFFFVDVKDKDGKVATWGLEHASPQSLYRAGYRKDDLAPGSEVEVSIMPGIREPNRGRVRFMLHNGKRYYELGLAAVSTVELDAQ